MSRAIDAKFDFEDFRKQIVQMMKMGSVKDLMGKIPGMSAMAGSLKGVDADGEVKRIQGIIDSMTNAERSNPHMIDDSRRRRIATGAGVAVQDISSLIKQFDAMKTVVFQMATMTFLDKFKMMMGLGQAGAFEPGTRLAPPRRTPPKPPRRNRRRDSGDRDDDCASPVPRR